MAGRRQKLPPPAGPLSEQSVRAWLAAFIARRLGTSEDEIDANASFESYGLDSRSSVGASGDLEEAFSIRLAPGLLYEYPTIATLAAYLMRELEAPR